MSKNLRVFTLIAVGSTMLGTAQSLPQAAQQVIELQHIDVAKVDKSIDPCANFYQYVCNAVDAETPIPPDRSMWGPLGTLSEWNKQVLHQILEENRPDSPSRKPSEQKLGDFYGSCMTQAASDTNDFASIEPLLRRIDAMRSNHDIAGVLAAIHLAFDGPWKPGDNQTLAALFGFGPQPDFNDVRRNVAALDQGGLGMPSRDFYIRQDSESKSIREKYRDFISTLLELAGSEKTAATRDSETVLRMESAMAQAQMDNVSRRDPRKVNNRFTLQELQALTPAFDWSSYLKGIGSPASPVYLVSAPEFFKTVNGLLVKEDVKDWKIYLRWHLLLSGSSYLGKPWRAPAFTFFSVLSGQKQEQPDWRRCVEEIDLDMGDLLGQAYVARVFPVENKDRFLKMVGNIESAMHSEIDSAGWMQPETKREALAKLSAVMNKIGYPDKWIDYAPVFIRRGSYAANVQEATKFGFRRQLGFIGQPVDRTLWLMTPPTVNAYEDPQTNTINFPAGVLQPPLFDSRRDDVINYAAEGSTVGHELIHDFDDDGRKFDAQGKLRDWWSDADARAYQERSQCIVKEYTGPVPGVVGVQQDGNLTAGEDIADNGSVYLALSALAVDLKQQGKTMEEVDEHGLNNLQRFFIAFAAAQCTIIRPELQRTFVLSDPHSQPELRVNNVLSNMPEFRQAFGCKANQPMVHATRCRVW